MTTRRDFIRSSAVASAAAAAGIAIPVAAQNVVLERPRTEMKWSKAPCRFCGTGCGINVAVKEGRVVATHGDIHSEVNRGLNCVKGYFLSKIMCGSDRLTHPLLRKKNGVYAKDGEFETVSWDEAFDAACRAPASRRAARLQTAVDQHAWSTCAACRMAECLAGAVGEPPRPTPVGAALAAMLLTPTRSAMPSASRRAARLQQPSTSTRGRTSSSAAARTLPA